MKRILAGLVAVVMAVMVVPSASADDKAHLTDVRTEQYPTFDRVVLDLTGVQPSADVSRIDEPTNCGSGKPISATGAEFLEARLRPADGQRYGGPRNIKLNLPEVKSIVFTCDFEADLSIAIGVQDR